MIIVANNWLEFVEDLYSAKMNSVKVIDGPLKELKTTYINYVIRKQPGQTLNVVGRSPVVGLSPYVFVFTFLCANAFLHILIWSPCRFVNMFCCVELL